MCILLIGRNPTPELSLVVLHNRDEYLDRPFQKASVHTTNGQSLIYGTDQVGGGTWLAVKSGGEFSAVLNIRTQPSQPRKPKSRGMLPIEALSRNASASGFERLNPADYNPFNLVIGGPDRPTEVYSSLKGIQRSFDVPLLGLSNNSIDEQWEKARRIEAQFQKEFTVEGAFRLLASSETLPDERLPETGYPQALERRLSSAFVSIPDSRYQTVVSTVITVGQDRSVRLYEINHLNGEGIHEVRL
jgi:uncharacterized protein with NRDE domain